MDLVLIRHGQSIANQQGLLISTKSDGLTTLGISQSQRLADYFNALDGQVPDEIYCSPWERAKATASIIFATQSASIQYDERLVETNPGIYATWQESAFNQEFPDFYDNLYRPYQGGESHMQMASRVIDWIEATLVMKRNVDGLIAVVAHGGPISVILQHLLGMPIEARYPSFTVPNASYSKLVWRKDLKRYCVVTVGHQP